MAPAPHNLQAEESLLGAMLLSTDAIATAIDVLTGDDFYKPAHRHIFLAITDLWTAGEPADPVTVADELRRNDLLDDIGGQSVLSDLQAGTPATSNAPRYARIIAEHAERRRLVGLAANLAEAARAGDTTEIERAIKILGSLEVTGKRTGREVVLTPVADIAIRPVSWAWENRLPSGALAMAAGREGTGKSQFGSWLTSEITRGTLPGNLDGTPRTVFYSAVEDSWSQTIAPRLLAAGADLDLVYRVEVRRHELADVGVLSLPDDLAGLEAAIADKQAAAVILDPLLSTMDATLDSHRNREVRQVLDPLAALADRTGAVVLGIAHFNKSSGSDASSLISGSGAFKDVPRSVFGFARDTDDSRVMSQTKNSLGRDDLASLAYAIEPVSVPTPEGDAHVSRIRFTGESDRSVADILRDAHGSPDERSDRDDAADWLRNYLSGQPDESAPAKMVFDAAKEAGIAERTLKRARSRAGVISTREGFGGGAIWSFGPHSGHSGQGSEPGPNGPNGGLNEKPGQLCDHCGEPADRTVTHHTTREEWCPTCCEQAFG